MHIFGSVLVGFSQFRYTWDLIASWWRRQCLRRHCSDSRTICIVMVCASCARRGASWYTSSKAGCGKPWCWACSVSSSCDCWCTLSRGWRTMTPGTRLWYEWFMSTNSQWYKSRYLYGDSCRENSLWAIFYGNSHHKQPFS